MTQIVIFCIDYLCYVFVLNIWDNCNLFHNLQPVLNEPKQAH
jgi:hypothetical protein